MNKIHSVIYLFILISAVSCTKKAIDTDVASQIENYVKEEILIQEIPGLALGVIKNGAVVYKGYFGKTDWNNTNPVNEDTTFPVYSITKLIVSTAIFQLVEENRISLEDSISSYLKNLPEHWENIQVKHLLTHSSGLPDFHVNEGNISDEDIWIKLINEGMHFEKGYQFEYNQTNYWLLAQIIETITGKPFEKIVLTNQFQNSERGVFFSSDLSKEVDNGAKRHEYNNEKGEYNISKIYGGKRYHAANGLNITLNELIEWNSLLDNNELLSSEQKRDMWKSFQYGNQQDEFLHGWHVYKLNGVQSFGFTGGSQTGFRKFVDRDLTIIILTNGYKYFSPHNDIINRVAGIMDSSLVYELAKVQHEIISNFFLNDFEVAAANFQMLKKKYPESEADKNTSYSFENTLNAIGYLLKQKKKLTQAIKVFELNTEENPTSANCFDSLAEAYYTDNQLNNAKKAYEMVLALNPSNSNAKEMIKVIEEKI
ncbi:MAG TPA: serine hydrolase [Fulvivirga sp.]|nr:serine hydrolase [Fulvivirga sp.]